jgi:hypothetical protein
VTRGALPLLAYASFLAVLTVVFWIWSSDTVARACLTAAVVAVAVGTGAWVVFARRSGPSDERAVPDLSAATALLGFSLPTMLVGAYLGLYLVLIGGGLTVLALGGLVREALAGRRARGRAGHGG